MHARTFGLAGLSGIAAFVLVGAVVTELLSQVIEFSLFLGIPAGLLAGVAAAFVVYARLDDPVQARRRPAIALAGFGAGFVVTLALGNLVVGLANSIALPAAAVVGVLAGVVAVLWPRESESRL